MLSNLHITNKQLTFPHPINATKVFPDGHKERWRYGQYEAVLIVKENGYHVNRSQILVAAHHPVHEVTCADGTKLIFDKPFYYIEKSGYGENSE
jgi:hypothetical protein